jgi:hypothetical protein
VCEPLCVCSSELPDLHGHKILPALHPNLCQDWHKQRAAAENAATDMERLHAYLLGRKREAMAYAREIMKTPKIMMAMPTNFVALNPSPRKYQAAMAFTT